MDALNTAWLQLTTAVLASAIDVEDVRETLIAALKDCPVSNDWGTQNRFDLCTEQTVAAAHSIAECVAEVILAGDRAQAKNN